MTEDWPEKWRYQRILPVTVEQYREILKIPKGTCTWCRGPSPSNRPKFCSDECHKALNLRMSDYYLKIKAKQRDVVCVKCGTGDHLEVDHIIPVSEGGGSCGLENVQVLCERCHLEKHNLYIDDFGRKASKHSNSGDSWAHQEKQLLELRAKGVGYKKIAEVLGRTRDAVRSRLRAIENSKV